MRLLWKSVIRPLFAFMRPGDESKPEGRESRIRERLRAVALEKALRGAVRAMEGLRERIAELERARSALRDAIDRMEKTRSWRYTSWLRRLEIAVRGRSTVKRSASPQPTIAASGGSGDGSQHGEISAIRALLPVDGPRFLVDVGAHDGRLYSNSAPFIDEGWKAVLIEPHPLPFIALENRHVGNANVRCVNVACAERSGFAPLYIGVDRNLTENTLSEDRNEWFAAHRGDDAIVVPVETLTDILRKHGAPKEFPLLLVDAEGMDFEVLLGLDFSQYVPRVIVTEVYGSNPEKHRMKHELLRRNGYALRARVGCNELWARTGSA